MAISSSTFEYLFFTRQSGDERYLRKAVCLLNEYVASREAKGYILKHWQILPDGFIIMEFEKTDDSFGVNIDNHVGNVELWGGGETN